LILSRGWTDYDNFSAELASRIIEAEPASKKQLIGIIRSFRSPFFSLNNIDVNDFIKIFPVNETLNLLDKHAQIGPLTFIDVFPETTKVSIDQGKGYVKNLAKIDESVIQGALVDSLREKNATNCRGRGKDTVLEVADLEHFSLNVIEVPRTFATVAKGYKSVSGKTITWEDVAHQVIRAYNRTTPDHILLVLAKEPADSVISELVQYGKSIRNENLVVMADPLTLVRFLKARNVIQ
jgi:hypothetical protein